MGTVQFLNNHFRQGAICDAPPIASVDSVEFLLCA